jgi:hypothetical protein
VAEDHRFGSVITPRFSHGDAIAVLIEKHRTVSIAFVYNKSSCVDSLVLSSSGRSKLSKIWRGDP